MKRQLNPQHHHYNHMQHHTRVWTRLGKYLSAEKMAGINQNVGPYRGSHKTTSIVLLFFPLCHPLYTGGRWGTRHWQLRWTQAGVCDTDTSRGHLSIISSNWMRRTCIEKYPQVMEKYLHQTVNMDRDNDRNGVVWADAAENEQWQRGRVEVMGPFLLCMLVRTEGRLYVCICVF